MAAHFTFFICPCPTLYPTPGPASPDQGVQRIEAAGASSVQRQQRNTIDALEREWLCKLLDKRTRRQHAFGDIQVQVALVSMNCGRGQGEHTP